MIDITTRKSDEEQLQRIERLYRALLENSSDVISMISADGTTVYQSPSVERLLGYGPQELVGQKNHMLLHPEDRDRAARTLGDILTTDRVVGPVRFRVQHKTGAWTRCEILGQRFVDESGEVFAVINNRDVSDVVDAEEALQQLQEQTAQGQKMEAIGRLAGGIAHDFNNLLTVIIGYSETLSASLGPKDSHIEEVNEIRRAAERASVLTGQLLAFSRKQVLHPVNLDVSAVVREMSAMIRRLIGEHISLHLDLAPDADTVVADRSQIELVLMNLAVNARDAMPVGGTLTLRSAAADVRAGARGGVLEPGRYMTITVADTGSGITPSVRGRLFEPFFTTKEQGKGIGLGLSTVYGIVKQSGGHVFVESEVGSGTEFTIYLPAVTIEADAQETVPEETVPRGSETILLVEDEAAVRELARRVLTKWGYRVLTAESGMEALAISQRKHDAIDLVITDIVMPGMSGPDFCARLQTTHPGIAVMYISGYAGDTVLQHGVTEEGVTLLQKPFTPRGLAEKAREVLDDARRRRGAA